MYIQLVSSSPPWKLSNYVFKTQETKERSLRSWKTKKVIIIQGTNPVVQDQQWFWLGSEEGSLTCLALLPRSKSVERGARGIPSLLKVEKTKHREEKHSQRGTKETAGKPLQPELHCRAGAGPAIQLWPGGVAPLRVCSP